VFAVTCAVAGKLFIFEVSRDGKATNTGISVYGNAFAIYGLAAYAQATGSAEARTLALNTFKTLDRLFHDARNGGYDESSAGVVLDSIPLRPTPRGSRSDVATEAGERAAHREGKTLSQSFNTLLHVAEALTELSKALKGSDPTVIARFQELLQLLTGRLIIRPYTAGANTPAAYIGPNYDPHNWSSVGAPYSNYGEWI